MASFALYKTKCLQCDCGLCDARDMKVEPVSVTDDKRCYARQYNSQVPEEKNCINFLHRGIHFFDRHNVSYKVVN